MEQFAVDDLVIGLMARRKECMHSLYTACTSRIEEFIGEGLNSSAETISEYFTAIAKENERAREEENERERKRDKSRKRRLSREKAKNSKRRKSMIVTIDDVSFSFGKDELEQITDQDKQVDPEVKDILQKMNDLFKQLGKEE